MSMGAAGENFEEINVTPLTDVFLVLLVIMILIAPLIDKSELKIKPPETQNAKKDDESKGIFIDVDETGQIAINGRFVPSNEPQVIREKIEEQLKKLGKKDVACTVNADAESKQKDIVAIMQAAAEAGIKRMRVATQQAGSY
ncbi:MAG: biopolymer transporter ExbD [Candidatus Melainabacteria bacterium]|jgi:biopolymer transport protein ExbD/biopolymer transport protein TolR|nr:biopolymer transporter ExbD [Candidatus Melainabacteria bacterium]